MSRELSDLSQGELQGLLEKLHQLSEYDRYHHAETFKPYPKQREFIRLSQSHHESAIFAGNQVGKTECGAFAVACHMSGRYPPWWQGRRFTKATAGWIAGETSVSVRDTQQKKLCGQPGVQELFGTGMIAREDFVGMPSISRGVTDAFDTIHVRHVSGGISAAQFKSYEQKRPKFQGDTKDWVWTDEECPMDIYTEILARITATDGIVFSTFTPLKGRTDLVIRYMDKPDSDRAYVMMSLEEAEHMTPKMIEDAVKRYPAHEREARVHGVPILGEGRVFPYPEELITEPGIPTHLVPDHWGKLWGLDFSHGGSHPFAAVLLLHDRDQDVIHVHALVKIMTEPGQPGGMPINHAAAMREIGGNVPCAWPHDGGMTIGGLSSRDTATIAQQYKAQELIMLPQCATFPDGGFGTEAGIMMMAQRMQNGKLKVAAHLMEWWHEFRNYHRKEGLLVKVNDDLMSATRIGMMQIRSARPVQLGLGKPAWAIKRDRLAGQGAVAEGTDFELT